MKKTLNSIALICAGLVGVTGQAMAANCGDTNRIYNLYDMTSEIINKNGSGTIGPRRLVTHQTSKVQAFFTRQFISPTPLDTNTIHIDFEKTDGSRIGGKVTAVVCATDTNGNATKLGEVTYKGGKKNIGDKVSRTYYGLKNKRLSVRMVGQAAVGSSTIDIDIIRNRNEGQPYVPPSYSRPSGPVTGFADVHVHQASDLAFSKGWYWGSHLPGNLVYQAPQCTGDNHATLEPLGIQLHELAANHVGQNKGYPDYQHWPKWNDIKHQQVTATWLKQAHDRGLSVMIASVVNNQTLAAAAIASGKHDNTVAPFDMESARLQIQSIKKMAEQEDWFEIVLDPWQARRAVDNGKLAVILAVEVSNLFPSSDGPWKEQLWDLYDMGVRTVQLAHETNNDFTGAAYHVDLFEILSQLKSWFDDGLEYAEAPDGVHNEIGLTSQGYALLREMMRLNMLIDIAHLPLKSQRQIYQVAAHEYSYYPLYNSHTRIDELLLPEDSAVYREFVTTDETLEYVRATGGVLGLRTGKQGMQTYANSGVTNNCDGSSRSFAQFYRYAADKNVATAFASDFNGFIEQMPPRYGTDGCASAPAGQQASQKAAQGWYSSSTVPSYVAEYHQKGLAHIGLLPALLHDLNTVGADTGNLNNSAENVVKMWDRIYDSNRGKVWNIIQIPKER